MAENPRVPTLEQELQIGQTRLRENMLNLAELIFERVLTKAPTHPVALRLLGVTLHKLGETQAGIHRLRDSTRLAPDVQLGWWDLAVVLRDAGQVGAARQALQVARDLLGRDSAARPLPALEQLTLANDHADARMTLVDYPYRASIRYGAGLPPHPELNAIIGKGRPRYGAFLSELGEIQSDLAQIPLGGFYESSHPFWLNSWFPALDGMALIQMLRQTNPARFVEIGSGISTKFARHAINTYGLRTTLTSIDPQPRTEVDKLCDEVIRKPLESCESSLFESLEAGDVLFLDSSHRSFQNSDVTVFFLEILPRLKPGVIVHIHDIYLPDDYISGHQARWWNEQYMLATALLFGGSTFEILFPCWYVGRDPQLLAQALLRKGPLNRLDLYGCSFWMRKV